MDEKKANRVSVTIFGEEYYVTGEENAEYIQTLAAFADRRLNYFRKRNPNLSNSKVAVLTVLNLADELNKLQDDYDEIVTALEETKKNFRA